MALDKSEFRRVLGHFATGVTVITTHDPDGKPFGLTANAVTSLSLVPPLLLICVDKSADCYACFEESKVFTVNVLAEEQEALSRRFATKGVDKFEGVGYRRGRNGCAILEDAVAYMECSLTRAIDGGDHTIYLGQVDTADASEVPPLLFFRGGYRKLAT
jgi:3-hydroxy-9,10-secoandrosta-1,3,5(10)-triene-9,17-dione monooxygenase reductase component